MPSDALPGATLHHIERDDRVEAYLTGEVDLFNSGMVSAALDQLVASGKNVVIHLDDLSFVDIPTAKLIFNASEAARRHGRVLRVVNPRPTVRRLLILLGMDALLSA